MLVFQKWRIFSERVCNFSLRSRAIGLSDFFGPRRKVALLGEDYAWALVWRSFDKLHEVGVLSYLFYPLFKCFVMLELIESVSGRLIVPKNLGPKCENFWNPFG